MKNRILILGVPLMLAGAAIWLVAQPAKAASGSAPDLGAASGPAPVRGAASATDCLACHESPELKLTWSDSSTTPLYVDPMVVQQSVHGQIGCEGCHTGYSSAHRTVSAQNEFEYEREAMGLCQGCHPDQFSAVQSSVHAGLQGMGITCQSCHDSHSVEPAQTASLRGVTLALCRECHEDQALMQPYGLSSSVVTTYLKDFHGRTSLLLTRDGQTAWIDEAVCMDCHGVHEISKVDSPNSLAVRDNLTATCQKCHESATPNFPASWMAHYAPSPSKTPLVFLARTFYWIMIPFTLIGLVVHIGIDIRHHRKLSRAGKE